MGRKLLLPHLFKSRFQEAAVLKKRNYQTKIALQSYLMLLPTIIGTAMFVVYPLVWVFRYCMFRFTGFGRQIYIGLNNFVRVFSRDPRFWESVLNSFIFTFGKLIVELPLALLLAVFLAKKFRGSSFFRMLFYLPAMLSVAIVGLQFSYLFGTTDGVINGWFKILGMSSFLGQSVPVGWFSTKAYAMCVLMIASTWQYTGVNMLFFMTGLQSVPEELYEAADIDGAGKWQRFFKITLPMLGPVTQMVVLNAILGSLKVTDLILVLTNGQPSGKTEVMMSYIFKLFFGSTSSTASDYGYAAALVMIAGVILGIVAIVYLKVTKKSSTIY